MDEVLSKTIKNEFMKRLTVIKMWEAHNRAKQQKASKVTVMKFELDLENNLSNLVSQIKNGTYHAGKYHNFTIYEPKERLIRALPYRDRVVHQWYVHEFIKPYIEPKFIIDSYACLENRGTHKAVEKLQYYMRIMKRKYGSYYIIKCDIKKFFYSIHKETLFLIMKKHIADKKLLDFTWHLIFDDDMELGIPIGNYTSQFFANILLNELDHYVKEQLHLKYYIRYMDDFIILVPGKEEAKQVLLVVKSYIEKNLKLELNHKSRYMPNHFGVTFCGYRIFETHRLLKQRSKKKIRKKIKKWNRHYLCGNLDETYAIASWNSWVAHSNHCNSYHYQKKMYESCLWKNKLPSS